MRFGDAGGYMLNDHRHGPGLRTCPLRCRYGAAAVVLAASGAADGGLVSLRAVALVDSLAKTAGVGWRSRGR